MGWDPRRCPCLCLCSCQSPCLSLATLEMGCKGVEPSARLDGLSEGSHVNISSAVGLLGQLTLLLLLGVVPPPVDAGGMLVVEVAIASPYATSITLSGPESTFIVIPRSSRVHDSLSCVDLMRKLRPHMQELKVFHHIIHIGLSHQAHTPVPFFFNPQGPSAPMSMASTLVVMCRQLLFHAAETSKRRLRPATAWTANRDWVVSPALLSSSQPRSSVGNTSSTASSYGVSSKCLCLMLAVIRCTLGRRLMRKRKQIHNLIAKEKSEM